MLSFLLILLVVVLVVFFSFRRRTFRQPASALREEEWEYGDVWKEGLSAGADRNDTTYVELFRTDTGRGYDDSALLDLVGYLGSRGIRATYDSFSLGLEPAAIKTYVLKVEQGKEEEALELLREKVGKTA